jgi:hypothetical protein
LTDAEPGECSTTSPCGNITVTIAEGKAPKVELAKTATGLFPRDLAELVTTTARQAADAARAEAPQPETPSIGDALDILVAFRDGIRDNGYAAAVLQQRSQLDPEAEPAPPQDDRPARGPKLALPPIALETLDNAIGLWQKYQAAPPGTGKDAEHELPTGRGKSEGKLATVEATFAYPIADVTLSRHACELGPRALESQLNEAVALAAKDLARQQGGYMNRLGVPIDPDEASTATETSEQLGAEGVRLVETARLQQERLTRQFNEGGHFA